MALLDSRSSPAITPQPGETRDIYPSKVGVLSVVPSPYQRDLFGALAARPEVHLTVFYQESAAPDSPWPHTPLASYESVLPGTWLGVSPHRLHVNWKMPDFTRFDFVILNTSYMSTATQWLMRHGLNGTPWAFWGERLRDQVSRMKQAGQRILTEPIGNGAAVAAIGSLAERAYRSRFTHRMVANIPYYCDLTGFEAAARQRVSREEVAFLCCGQMIHRKGIDVLLRAFDGLCRLGMPVRLMLVGREAELPAMMEDIGSETRARIDFRGFCAPVDLPMVFAEADVFVLPSRYDGWGVVVNQAIGAGLPVICSAAVGAAHDVVVPEKNGAIVPAGEVEALRQIMQRLALDADLREAWSRGSRDVAPMWSPKAGAKKWVTLIHTLLKKQA